jgi:2-dehydropantoate 2-reductase
MNVKRARAGFKEDSECGSAFTEQALSAAIWACSAGAEVSLVARGAHLDAMNRNGINLVMDGGEFVAHPRCTKDATELGPQDLVIVALKAHSIPPAVPAMRPLIGNDTAILTAVNGIPYWYFYEHGGKWQGSVVESVDPDGVQWRVLGPHRAIGCVVYPAAEVVAPASFVTSMATRYRLASPTERSAQESAGLRRSLGRPVSMRRSASRSGTRSG